MRWKGGGGKWRNAVLNDKVWKSARKELIKSGVKETERWTKKKYTMTML